MKNVVAWLNTITPAHLLGIVAFAVLLAIGVGPQEVELTGLFGLIGLSIPTTPPTGSGGA